jgi:hypothetical protein
LRLERGSNEVKEPSDTETKKKKKTLQVRIDRIDDETTPQDIRGFLGKFGKVGDVSICSEVKAYPKNVPPMVSHTWTRTMRLRRWIN